MNVITLILVLVIVGFCLWLVLSFVPMPTPLRQVIVALIAIALVLWVLDATGIYEQRWLRFR